MKKQISISAGREETLVVRTSTDVMQNEDAHYSMTLEEDAKFSLTYIENRPTTESSKVFLTITLKKNAQLELATIFTGASTSGLILKVIHEGEGAQSMQKTLFFGSYEQHFDIESTTTLDAPNTSTNIIAKGVLNQSAKARFDGSIHITHNGKDSSGHLHEHTLLLSSGSQINAVPALKIEHNQVQASHSASVTRVDDEHLFYCGARGIDEAMATKLIVDGFLGELYRDSALATELDPLFESKIAQLV